MRAKVQRHRRCAPSPACGGGLGWGCFRIGISVWREPPPAALFERVGLPRKRERRASQPISLVNAICDCPASCGERVGGEGLLQPIRLLLDSRREPLTPTLSPQ